jgi:hypothetical protein
MDALDILRQASMGIPFIVVTGTLGDERAVEYLQSGTHRLCAQREVKQACGNQSCAA